MKALSELQKRILLMCYRHEENMIEKHGRKAPLPYSSFERKDWSNSKAASFSRSLRRLEQRELLWRLSTHGFYGSGGKLTYAVSLTSEGRELAETLSPDFGLD